MSDSSERPADGSAPRDPWAPPDNKVPLEKNTGDTRPAPDDATGDPAPPPVHDQQTVISMPNAESGPIPTAGFGPPGQGQPAGPWQGPGSVPPPPVGPNGPGQATPPPGGQYGYPAPPQSQYGYPAPPGPQPGGYPSAPGAPGYPGYPGYAQNTWGGPGPANGMGVASLVLGIISVVTFCMCGLGIVLGLLALIFGLIGRGRATRGEADNGGVALAGIITGAVGLVISAVFLGMVLASDDFRSGYEDSSLQPSVSVVVDATHP
ncbi:DUF4190 domain-containing protein [Streptomyces sp. NPDC050421]